MPNVWPYVALELLNCVGNWVGSYWLPSYSDAINFVSASITIGIVFAYAWSAAKRATRILKVAVVSSMIWVLSVLFMAATSIVDSESTAEMSLVVRGILLSGLLIWPAFIGLAALAAWLSGKRTRGLSP